MNDAKQSSSFQVMDTDPVQNKRDFKRGSDVHSAPVLPINSRYSWNLKDAIVIQTRCSHTPHPNILGRFTSTSVINESGFHTSGKITLNE
jgi:hypothetical protein